MRFLLLVFALTLACAAAATAAEPCPTGSTVAPSGAGPSVSPPVMIPAGQQVSESCLRSNLNLSTSQIADLRSQGFSDSDIAMIGAIAKRSNRPVGEVAAAYRSNPNWSSVSQQFNVSLSDANVLATSCFVPQSALYGAGPAMPVVMYDYNGNVLLTWDEVQRYYAQGYDWMDIAVAANISRESGYPISMALMDIQRGVTWRELAMRQAVPPSRAFNLSTFPFPRRSTYSDSAQEQRMQTIERYQVPVSTNVPATTPPPTMMTPAPIQTMPDSTMNQ
ncbi:MAG: hypothetical protein ABFD54_05265 [Armatimonadota bacterium]|nr:hypothetical protein [bacterium]